MDANGESGNTKIIGSQLSGALAVDSNNLVLVSSGGVPRASYNYGVSRINYDVWMPNGYVTLNWDGANAAPIALLGGAYDLDVQDNLGVIKNNATGANGNITLTTSGAGANSSYSILIELDKTPGGNCDFNMGQIQSPSDFQAGKYAVKP